MFGRLARAHYDRGEVMANHHRRAFRHSVALDCQVVRARDFRLVACTVVDLSDAGMQVSAMLPVLTGEDVLVSFRAPRSGHWIDADAVVARVIHGRRPGDQGRCLGLSFQGLGDDDRAQLFRALQTFPPSGRRGARREHRRRAAALT